MKYIKSPVIAAVVLLLPLWGAAEISIIKAPDGRALQLLKLTQPERDLIWEPLSLGFSHVETLNPGGDRRADMAPVIVLIRSKQPSSEGIEQGIIEWPDLEANIIASHVPVASVGLLRTSELSLLAVWPKRDREGYRLYWSEWLEEYDTWSRPERVTSFSSMGDEIDPVVTVTGFGWIVLSWTEQESQARERGSFWTGSGWSAAFRMFPAGIP
ncbi:hypothetical protein ACFLU6_02770 [Acidobacteriota bacterium]